MEHKPLLSVIIPAYNEEKRIGVTLADLERYFSDKRYAYEVIVISDGSTDGTADVVKSASGSFRGLRLVEYSPNRGKGYAVRAGMLEARGSYRLFMDADNSVAIETVEPFLREMREDSLEVTIGSIAFSDAEVVEHNGWHRRVFGSVSKILVRAVATPGIYDTQRGFKLFTARAAEAIFPLQKVDRFGFDIEILVIARMHGFSIRELPVSWDNPAGSKVHFRAYVDSFIELWRIYGNMLRGHYAPAHARRSRAKRASMLVLFLGEFPSLMTRFIRELLTSDINLRRAKRRLQQG
ncbi:MAG: glycosyltransferase family 2 protein [Patescibacteria group bacterium]|nr:glycosyltransferase family 2 protein [Patescibacteria group bacterium]MDE2116292.1 glycosyltransferase family 2 protein [Patescibacteria group bacterium]